MSRNGTGNYSVPNTFVSGTVITASDHNENWSDIASEITNSVASDGQTTMAGPLKAAAGTLGAPSHTFGADTDTGRYRKSANTMADVCGGVEVVEISSSGISVTGDISATTVNQGGARLLPPGVIMDYGGTSAPTGWLLCYGQAVSRATYAGLFSAISTTFGVGDNSTTFNLPDLRGRVAAGKDDMGGSAASRITAAGGNFDAAVLGATQDRQNHTLTTGQLPSHTHPITDPGHVHGSGTQLTGATGGQTVQSGLAFGGTNTLSATTGITATDAAGGAESHPIVQPTIILNKIIKT